MTYPSKTIVCSVLSIDVADFSQRSVREQVVLKERFNAIVTKAMAGIDRDDRIIRDTGGGATVSFLRDPERAAFVGSQARDALDGLIVELPGLPHPWEVRVRVGIDFGPMRLCEDVNGRLSIVGESINSAERIMSFADGGQILVSRSYRDIMVAISEKNAKLFRELGQIRLQDRSEVFCYQSGGAKSV